MIDNLISDPMKEIWNYILKDMNFLFFKDFSRFFLIFLNLKSIYLN